MGNKEELCPTCQPQGKCIFEEAIMPQTAAELKGKVRELKSYAKKIGCTRMPEAGLILEAKKNHPPYRKI